MRNLSCRLPAEVFLEEVLVTELWTFERGEPIDVVAGSVHAERGCGCGTASEGRPVRTA